MGRFGLKIVFLLALALFGWWWFATAGMQRGIQAWLDTNRTGGREASIEKMARGGFPLRIATTLQGLRLSDPPSGKAVDIPQVTLSTPIYWPGDATLQFPAIPVTFTTPHGDAVLTSQGAEAAMHLLPGRSLQLTRLAGSTSLLTLESPVGRLLSIGAFETQIVQGATPEIYEFNLLASDLALGGTFQEALTALPPDWPDSFEPIVAKITATFDRPWDRSALETTRPQPRAITVEQLEAVYGDLGVTLSANLAIDAAGIADGTLRVRLRNWQQIFDIAVAAMQVSPQWAPAVGNILTMLSDSEGTLDLDITVEQGQMRIAFFQLGTLPRLVIP
jgi:hypothetical protein